MSLIGPGPGELNIGGILKFGLKRNNCCAARVGGDEARPNPGENHRVAF